MKKAVAENAKPHSIAPGAATSFVVERSTSADFSTDVVATVVTAGSDSSPYITFNDTAVAPDTNYFYQVLANNAGGTTAETDTASASTILAAPSGLAASAVQFRCGIRYMRGRRLPLRSGRARVMKGPAANVPSLAPWAAIE